MTHYKVYSYVQMIAVLYLTSSFRSKLHGE